MTEVVTFDLQSSSGFFTGFHHSAGITLTSCDIQYNVVCENTAQIFHTSIHIKETAYL